MDDAERGANAVVSVDLEKQEIRGPDGGCVKFDIDPFRKQCLLNGWDDIGLTLRNETKISDFETRRKTECRGREAHERCCTARTQGRSAAR